MALAKYCAKGRRDFCSTAWTCTREPYCAVVASSWLRNVVAVAASRTTATVRNCVWSASGRRNLPASSPSTSAKPRSMPASRKRTSTGANAGGAGGAVGTAGGACTRAEGALAAGAKQYTWPRVVVAMIWPLATASSRASPSTLARHSSVLVAGSTTATAPSRPSTSFPPASTRLKAFRPTIFP